MPPQSTAAHSAETLTALATRLTDFSGDFSAIAEQFRKEKFGSLTVTHEKQRRDAIANLNNFLHAVRQAMDDAREARGDYAPKNGAEAPVTGRKKP